MKRCHCQSNECNGEVERFSIYSPSEDIKYPNRFWGVVDYCETHKEQDECSGFVLQNAEQEERVYVL